MTDNEFVNFLINCHQELDDKQEALLDEYNIDTYDEYWYDQTTETIQFKNDGKVELEFIFVPIGSWSSKSNTWMWAWANNSITDELKSKSIKLKELANYTDSALFEKEEFEADESMAWKLTSVSVHHLNALGTYIAPSNNLKSFHF